MLSKEQSSVCDLEEEIKASKEYMFKQESIRKDATEKALKSTDPAKMKMSIMTAKFASEAAENMSRILNEKQEELAMSSGAGRGEASSVGTVVDIM